MKVLIINGSPRIGGNTSIAIKWSSGATGIHGASPSLRATPEIHCMKKYHNLLNQFM